MYPLLCTQAAVSYAYYISIASIGVVPYTYIISFYQITCKYNLSKVNKVSRSQYTMLVTWFSNIMIIVVYNDIEYSVTNH